MNARPPAIRYPRVFRARVTDPAYCERSEIPQGRPGRAVRCESFDLPHTNGHRSYQFTPDGSSLTWLVPIDYLDAVEEEE